MAAGATVTRATHDHTAPQRRFDLGAGGGLGHVVAHSNLSGDLLAGAGRGHEGVNVFDDDDDDFLKQFLDA